jgi:hypothetical protein
MNKKLPSYCLLGCGILCIVLIIFVFNRDDYVTELTFSQESGFYDQSFELVIKAPKGSTIYYTLDGTVPTKDSLVYDEPINIEDATLQPNLYSARADVSFGYSQEAKAVWDYGYEVPDYNVDKATVVRALYYYKSDTPSEVKSATYFVGYDAKTGYDDMNIISIITDPDNLFGYENGIYVAGKTFDDEGTDNNQWWSWPANYKQRGQEWERPATVEFYNADRELFYSKECGIRIQGNRSRSFAQKSFNLYARKDYDGSTTFDYDFFGTGYNPDKMTLFSGADDRVSKLRDNLVSDLCSDRDITTMNYVPYVVFIDGEYWGVYYLTEKYDSDYFKYYYNIGEDNAIVVKAITLEEGNEEDMDLYYEMSDYITTHDMSEDDNYAEAEKMIDIQSLIDYYAVEIYIGRNGDWPGSNEALWRCRKTGKGQYLDGKWRWIIYDVNGGSLELQYLENDTLKYAMDSSPIFGSLCQSEKFRQQFADTIIDIARNDMSAERYDPFIVQYLQKMTNPISANLRRYYGDNITADDFIYDVSEIKAFMDGRYPYIVQSLYDNFNIEVE